MATAATLVQSSSQTRSWLRKLRDRFPDLEYNEAKYYAALRRKLTLATVAYLNPSQRSIRLFLPLAPVDESGLQPTPSTSTWAARFPSVFLIIHERDLAVASALIEKAVSSQKSATSAPRKKSVVRPDYLSAEELSERGEFFEGASRSVRVNAYERNRKAREKCLRHYGRSCSVCGLSFETRYGELAAGYIQIHHLVPIASVEGEYRLNPIADLRPVCPNCHAVIHRREPPFSIEEVRMMLRGDSLNE